MSPAPSHQTLRVSTRVVSGTKGSAGLVMLRRYRDAGDAATPTISIEIDVDHDGAVVNARSLRRPDVQSPADEEVGNSAVCVDMPVAEVPAVGAVYGRHAGNADLHVRQQHR